MHGVRRRICTQRFYTGDVRVGSKAAVPAPSRHVRSAAVSGIPEAIWRLRKCANNGSGQPYSITSLARASREGGTVSPSALAVLRLITSSNLVGCSTGSSTGLAPFNRAERALPG
jgi:hypothetical protein